MIIKFKPVTKIKRMVKGRRVEIFSPSYVYDGIQNEDGTLRGYCPKFDKYFKIGVNDYMVER